MTDKNKTTENRRKLLKSVAAGGGAIIAGKTLPETWTRPAVESVVLPAHARTSGGPFSGSTRAALGSNTMLAKAMETFIPTAHAQPATLASWCITPDTDKATTVYFLLVDDINEPPCWAELWEGTDIVANGTAQPLSMASPSACNDVVSSNNWLEGLGLVRDANASVLCELTLHGITEGSGFRFENGPHEINFEDTLVTGLCGDKSVDCGSEKACD